MSKEVQITFDCGDPDALCRFWVEALDYEQQPPPPGFDSWDAFLDSVKPQQRDRNEFIQRVPEGKSAKNRVHLDVRAAPGVAGDERMAALQVEADRLVDLGATELRRVEPDGGMETGFITMADPEGNEFCLD